jgi:septal ring factor EnvC (AmiA/AmiB activator)
MTSLTLRYRLAALGAASIPLVLAACSVEQTTNRCTAESTTLDGLIKCVREMHAGTRKCETAERGPGAIPVAGRRLLKFGEVTKHGGTSRGIVFEGARGAEVRAPVSGLVTFADPWRSYGDLLIIDSCTTVALMAGALSPEVIAGQSITAGGAVARLRQTSSSDTPVLYLEVRENETAIDPATVIPQD